MLFRWALRDYGPSFPVSVTITVDYKQSQKRYYLQLQQHQYWQKRRLQPRESSSSSTCIARDSSGSEARIGFHEIGIANDGDSGFGRSIVNTAFLFLYHIAWRLHGFLDSKKPFFPSCLLAKTIEGLGRKDVQLFDLRTSTALLYDDDDDAVAFEEQGRREDYGGDEETGSPSAALRLSSSFDECHLLGVGSRRGGGTWDTGGESWHDMDT